MTEKNMVLEAARRFRGIACMYLDGAIRHPENEEAWMEKAEEYEKMAALKERAARRM